MTCPNAECQCLKNFALAVVLFETWALNVGLPEFDIGLEFDKVDIVLNVSLPEFVIGLELALNAKLDKPVFNLRRSFDLVLEFDKFDIGLEWALNAKLDKPVFEFGIPRIGMALG